MIKDESIKQLFIDNLNGVMLLTKNIEKKNINDFLNLEILNINQIIINVMKDFYGENIFKIKGKYKNIDKNNFMVEFSNFIDNCDEAIIINDIKRIIISQIDDKETIIDNIIKKNYINKNTIDFMTAIINYIKCMISGKIKILLYNSENNNFFTTIFLLNMKNNEKENNELDKHSLKSDIDILKNDIIIKVKKEFLKLLKYEKCFQLANINLNYKIPGFYSIYKEISQYIEMNKIAYIYSKDEKELRFCENELSFYAMKKLREDEENFKEELYNHLKSKKLINKVFEIKNIDKNYYEFIQLFLNDYLTFFLFNIYNNKISDFVFDDDKHKIISLLLDLKFNELKGEGNHIIQMKDLIGKIIWLEANSIYIKIILDLINLISEDISNEKIIIKNILSNNTISEIKYETTEEKLKKVNTPYFKILVILLKEIIKKIASKNNNNNISYFGYLKKCLNEIRNLNTLLKIKIEEINIIDEYVTIYNAYEGNKIINKLDINKLINSLIKNLEILKQNNENKIMFLCNNSQIIIDIIKNGIEINNYYELIINIFLSELNRENNRNYKLYILNEFLLNNEKLFVKSKQLLKIILEDFVSSDINKFQGALSNLSDSSLEFLENKMNNEWFKETLINFFECISIIYIQNLINNFEKYKKAKGKNILIHLKSFFEKCTSFLESLFKGLKNEKIKLEAKNINLKKAFSIAFVRIYIRLLIDYLEQERFTKRKEIIEIIESINGNEINEFRDILNYFIYNIIWNKNKKDINKLFENEIKLKYCLNYYSNYNLLLKEIESNKSLMFLKNVFDNPKYYNEKKYPYYKNFLYSEYLDINFYRKKFEEELNNKSKDRMKYPFLELYLNGKGINDNFLYFNFVIKLLLNQYSCKIFRDQAKKISFEQTNVYRRYTKICDNFIELINLKIRGNKLSKESNLENFLIDDSQNGQILIDIYEENAKIQNDILNIINFKTKLEYPGEELQLKKIDIQEARKENLIILETEDKLNLLEILLMNTNKDIYTLNSQIKYNNYNSFLIDYNRIENILRDNFTKYICFLSIDNIMKIKYKEEDFLNDGLSELNKNIKIDYLDETDKKNFIKFYIKNLENNLLSCYEINDNIIKIITYANNNIQKVNSNTSLSNIINQEDFNFEINSSFKEFLYNNSNFILSKLNNLVIYFENLYFETVLREKKEYKEKINEEIKKKIDEYYTDKNKFLITKEKLSFIIIRFLIYIEIAKNRYKNILINLNDNIFDYLSLGFFWDNKIIKNPIFIQECEEYKNFDINIKNAYDLYCFITKDTKRKFDLEKKELIEKIKIEENLLSVNIKTDNVNNDDINEIQMLDY